MVIMARDNEMMIDTEENTTLQTTEAAVMLMEAMEAIVMLVEQYLPSESRSRTRQARCCTRRELN